MITFDIVVADPSWAFNDKLTMSDVKRGAEANYPVLSVEQIASLPVPSSPDALLLLWVPATLLWDAYVVQKAWGFTYKGLWVWGKCKKDMDGLAFGMGHTFRQANEVALVCTKGSPIRHIVNKAQRSMYVELVESDGPGLLSPTMPHSKKPEQLQDSLELMWPEANKLELFARRERDGWLCLGNEISGRDIRDELRELGA